jgi:hypothetical protein
MMMLSGLGLLAGSRRKSAVPGILEKVSLQEERGKDEGVENAI